MSSPKVDICVLTHNSSEVTGRFLPHLLNWTAGVPYALHLLDNGSDELGDQNWRIMQSLKANTKWWGNLFRPRYRGLNLTIERSERNLNFAGGNNLLAEKGRAPWILFLNNDAFPQKRDWLYKLVATCENGGFLAAGPTSDRVMGYQMAHWNDRLPQVHHIHVLSGFCVLIQREAFEHVGGWDERFDNGDEDLDMSLAIRNYGWLRHRNPAALACNRRVFVHHEMSRSLAPWCQKQGKTIEQHFKKTHEKLVAKRGERVLLDAFFIEDVKRPYSEWAKIGVLPNGTYYKQASDPDSAAQQFGGHGTHQPGRNGRGGGASSQGNADRRVGEDRTAGRGAGGAVYQEARPAGGAGQNGSGEGRRNPGEEAPAVVGHDSPDERAGVQEVRQAHRLHSGGNGRHDPGSPGLPDHQQGDWLGQGGRPDGGIEEAGHPAFGLPAFDHHIGITTNGGCVHRLERPGGECRNRGLSGIVRCSCEAEAV